MTLRDGFDRGEAEAIGEGALGALGACDLSVGESFGGRSGRLGGGDGKGR